MNPSLVISLKKAGREIGFGALFAAIFGGLAFLSDPVVVGSVLKDPPPLVLLALPLINAVARIALDQLRHNPALKAKP